jgi:hypothetical protein
LSRRLILRGYFAMIGGLTDLIDYVPLGQLEGVSEKAVRDAAAIPVAEI